MKIGDARTRIAVSLAGIHDFQTAATSATSPILGPSRLTAKQMADFVVAQHYTPHITVPIEVLAQIYLDEGADRRARRRRVRAVDTRDGRLREPGKRGDRQQLRRHRLVRLLRARLRLPRRQDRCARRCSCYASTSTPRSPDPALQGPILLPGTLTLGFRGKVQTWWDLWGTWATGALYGQRVYDIYERMVVFARAPSPRWRVKPTGGSPRAGEENRSERKACRHDDGRRVKKP